jgi:N6-L-threonylcarbamoyladenine synthase
MKHTTLAIESTCDDSSLALVSYEDGTFVLDNMLTHTQGMHAKFGGVVPEYASREHAKMLPILLQQMDLDRNSVDSITVAAQP